MNEEDLRNVLIKLSKEFNEKEEDILQELYSEKISAEEFIDKKLKITEEFKNKYEDIRSDFILTNAIIIALNKAIEATKRIAQEIT